MTKRNELVTVDEADTDFYAGTVEWSQGATSFLTNVWTWASHPGEAIHRMLEAAKNNHVTDPTLIDLDLIEFDDLAPGSIAVGDGLSYIEDTEYSFETEYTYKMPHGVVPTTDQHEIDLDEIRPGYEMWKNDEGLIEIDAVVERDDLLSVYLKCVSGLPEIRTFWIKIHGDWEDFSLEDEIYFNDEINTPTRIEDFLSRNKMDTLLNGHVTITTYVDEGETNLNISDHKTIVLMTHEKTVAASACEILSGCGLPKEEDILNVANGVHHWHYRHPDGLDRKGLVQLLETKGFRLLNTDNEAHLSAENIYNGITN